MLGELQWGVEIEFASPYSEYDLLQRLPIQVEITNKEPSSPVWFIGRDMSIFSNLRLDGFFGLELRSKRNPELAEVASVIQSLRKLGCRTTNTCGLHVHVSHPVQDIGIRLQMNGIWDTRLRWCGGLELREDKYRPVRRISNQHIEVRLYNGSLNTRHVLRSIKQALSSILLGSLEIACETCIVSR